MAAPGLPADESRQAQQPRRPARVHWAIALAWLAAVVVLVKTLLPW